MRARRGGRGPRVDQLVAFGVVVALAVGCANQSSGVSGAAPSTTTAPAAGASGVVRGMPVSEATTVPAAVPVATGAAEGRAFLVAPRCVRSAVQVSVDVQPHSGSQAPGRTRALIVVADVSAAPCTLSGFARVRVLKGRWLRLVRVDRLATRPGVPGVTLRTGVAAFALLGWSSRAGCSKVEGFDVTLPRDRNWVKAQEVGALNSTESVEMCPTPAELGPFVASAEVADGQSVPASVPAATG